MLCFITLVPSTVFMTDHNASLSVCVSVLLIYSKQLQCVYRGPVSVICVSYHVLAVRIFTHTC